MYIYEPEINLALLVYKDIENFLKIVGEVNEIKKNVRCILITL